MWRYFVTCVLFLVTNYCHALIVVHPGNVAYTGLPLPSGSSELINRPERIGYWEGPPFGGGLYTFEFQTTSTKAINNALQIFAAIDVPKLTLELRDGPYQSSHLSAGTSDGENNAVVDYSFRAWNPARYYMLHVEPNLARSSLRNPDTRHTVPPPEMVIYISSGRIAFDQLMIPENISVKDLRRAVASFPVRGHSARFRVFDMATGKPIDGAMITIENTFTKASDKNGIALLHKISEGYHEFKIKSPGYYPRIIGARLDKQQPYLDLRVELCQAAEISGRVIDDDGDPVSGAKVRCHGACGIDGEVYSRNASLETVTSANGTFTLSLPTGYAPLFVSHEMLAQAHPLNMYKVPASNVIIKMQHPGVVAGLVVGGADSIRTVSLVPNVTADLGHSTQYSVEVSPDGSFLFPTVVPGTYQACDGLACESNQNCKLQDIEVKSNTTSTLQLEACEK